MQITAVAYALFVLRPRRHGSMLLVALSPLVRPELALGLLLVGAWALLRERAAALRLIAASALGIGGWWRSASTTSPSCCRTPST